MTKSLEIIYVAEGLKKVSRIIVNEESVDSSIKLIKSYNLNAVSSEFKIKKVNTEMQYSDKGFRLAMNSKEHGELFIYVSRKMEDAMRAKIIEEQNSHAELGKILGYPDCCTRFFERHFPVESKGNNDYTLKALKDSDGYIFPYYTNIAVRHLDITPISHFPCNFNCHESIEIAKRNLKLIRILSSNLHKIFESILKSAVIYTENNGVYVFRNYKLNGSELQYDDVIGNANNRLFDIFKSQKSILIKAKNYFIAGDVHIQGDETGILVYA